MHPVLDIAHLDAGAVVAAGPGVAGVDPGGRRIEIVLVGGLRRPRVVGCYGRGSRLRDEVGRLDALVVLEDLLRARRGEPRGKAQAEVIVEVGERPCAIRLTVLAE